MNCCENPDNSTKEDTERKYSDDEAMAFICSLSKVLPIPRHRILMPIFFSALAELVTESVDFPAIITTSRRAETLAPTAAPPPAAPPPAPAPPPPALANRDDWHLESPAPAAQDPPTSFTWRRKSPFHLSLLAALGSLQFQPYGRDAERPTVHVVSRRCGDNLSGVCVREQTLLPRFFRSILLT